MIPRLDTSFLPVGLCADCVRTTIGISDDLRHAYPTSRPGPVAALSANPIQLADGSRQIRDGALVFDELAQTSEQTVEVLR